MWLKKPYNIDAEITSPFGERMHPIKKELLLHAGVDIGLPVGTELYAPLSGKVSAGYDANGYGYWIQVNSLTKQGTQVSFLFGHLKESITKPTVIQGEKIGLSGNSGNSTGPHLHFQVSIFDGKRFVPENPEKYFDFRNGVAA